jgi:hypothetical protein
MAELEAERRAEERVAALILNRARSLAWQAVRHTPRGPVRAAMCLAWIRKAGVWAAHREMSALSEELSGILERLEESLPRLATKKTD